MLIIINIIVIVIVTTIIIIAYNNNNYYYGKHPLSLTAVMYLAREKEGCSLHLVECECKLTKIKVAMKLYQNMDPSMRAGQQFKESVVEKGHKSLQRKRISLLKNWAQACLWSTLNHHAGLRVILRQRSKGSKGERASQESKADMEKLKEKINEEISGTGSSCRTDGRTAS